MKILENLQERKAHGKKSIAVLVDPDKIEEPGRLNTLLRLASENCIDFFFVGGSCVAQWRRGRPQVVCANA